MALQIVFEDQFGNVNKEAYARVEKRIVENPVSSKKSVRVNVSIYASVEARKAEKYPVWGPQGFDIEKVDPDEGTTKDVYVYLKTLDMFKDAVDV